MKSLSEKAIHLVDDNDWQEALRTALRSADDLVREGFISPHQKPAYERVISRYRFLLPRYYANLINKEDPQCPIRLQAIPDLKEILEEEGVADPLDDLGHQPEVRITHRYRHRLLLHLTPNCSMYCRYCFRKSLLNELSGEMFDGSYRRALDYIRAHSEVEEVILSGGDPFMANSTLLREVLQELGQSAHVQRIRFHSRVPVTLPQRVTAAFAELLVGSGKRTIVVTHFNHPRELTRESIAACERLRRAGVTLFNQSVLMRGVNLEVATLESLSLGLFDAGVLPYYLHHPDPAQGTSHFSIDPPEGMAVWRALKERLPGYLVPRYVIDRVDVPYKQDVEAYLNLQTGNI